LIRVTQSHESVIQTYFTDDNGDVVTVSLYDISSTDPADILGNDVIGPSDDEDEDVDEDDFDEAVMRRLERLRRRHCQRSGDSFEEETSSGSS
jgi:hypothetical protein